MGVAIKLRAATRNKNRADFIRRADAGFRLDSGRGGAGRGIGSARLWR
jgi:hypothetical protein